ncbi:MAG: 3-deoxy-D-manno-octulosonic acid transferase [Ignavibacteria bacterium]|nr:3-deoxy-D-manno-octulosonic acid transferase [Ignavibacteria bacterium]
MRVLWYWLYNVVAIPALWTVLQVASLFHRKIRRGIVGRRGLFEQLGSDIQKLRASRRIWIHASSMGEFEQAKPIIAALRQEYANLDIIASFFSPSGYEHSRSYHLADVITYIPFDRPKNARRFIDLVKPDVAVLVRYDVWPNHLRELKRRNIPTIIANATLQRRSARLVWPIRDFHYHVYENLSAILTVSLEDAAAFRYMGLRTPRINVVGETRYDQVHLRKIEAEKKHLLPQEILRRRKVFVVGSSWPEDEEVVVPAFRKIARYDSSALMILVPHEPTIPTLERLELELEFQKLRVIRFSNLADYSAENVVLVDSIGILLALYQYADFAYVGGSFRQGIHNVLEPAVYGIPVVFGPKHENSREAMELVARGGAFVVTSVDDCFPQLRRLFNDKHVRTAAGKAAFSLVQENVGATQKFVDYLGTVLKHRDSGL